MGRSKSKPRTRAGRPPGGKSGYIQATLDLKVKAELNRASDQLRTPLGHVVERVLRHVIEDGGGLVNAFTADLTRDQQTG